MAAWACGGGRPGSSYRISLLLSGKVPGEAKMPSQMEGAQWAGGSGTCTRLSEQCPHISASHQSLAPRLQGDTVQRPFWFLQARTSTYLAFPAIPGIWSSPSRGSPACCLLSIPLLYRQAGPHPWEQVRGPQGFSLPSPSAPHPKADRWRRQEGAAGPGHLSPPSQHGPHGPALGGAGGESGLEAGSWGWREGAEGMENRAAKVQSTPFQAFPPSQSTHGHHPSPHTYPRALKRKTQGS